MNTRIEVPLTLPPPHFEDDATIATARQVVPLKGAKQPDRRRRVLRLAPLLLVSTMCGALGAAAVNYYEQRKQTSAVATPPQALANATSQAKTEPATIPTPQQPIGDEPPVRAAIQSTDPAVTSAKQPTGTIDEVKGAKRDDEVTKAEPPTPKRETTPDAAKLVRKRRVQPPEPETPPQSRRSGAGRIEDIFNGPNP